MYAVRAIPHTVYSVRLLQSPWFRAVLILAALPLLFLGLSTVRFLYRERRGLTKPVPDRRTRISPLP
jgi:hypothetical protein